MYVYTKVGLAALALAMSCTPMFAQNQDTARPSGPAVENIWGPPGPSGAIAPGVMRGDWDHGCSVNADQGRTLAIMRYASSPEVLQKAGITTQEANQVLQEESTYCKAQIQQRANLAVEQIDLRSLLLANPPDRAAIDAKLQQIANTRLALARGRIDNRLNLEQALTAEQWHKLHEQIAEHFQEQRPEPAWQHGPAETRPSSQRYDWYGYNGNTWRRGNG